MTIEELRETKKALINELAAYADIMQTEVDKQYGIELLEAIMATNDVIAERMRAILGEFN